MVKNIKNALMSKKAKLMISLCAVSALATSAVAMAEETTGSIATVVEDSNVIVGVVKNIMSLFTVFPLNIFLAGSLICLAVAIFKKVRH